MAIAACVAPAAIVASPDVAARSDSSASAVAAFVSSATDQTIRVGTSRADDSRAVSCAVPPSGAAASAGADSVPLSGIRQATAASTAATATASTAATADTVACSVVVARRPPGSTAHARTVAVPARSARSRSSKPDTVASTTVAASDSAPYVSVSPSGSLNAIAQIDRPRAARRQRRVR